MDKRLIISLVLIWCSLLQTSVFGQSNSENRISNYKQQYFGSELDQYSFLDQSRILKGLYYTNKYFTDKGRRDTDLEKFINNNISMLIPKLQISLKKHFFEAEKSFETVSNLIEIFSNRPTVELSGKLKEWSEFFISQPYYPPPDDIGRLGTAMIILYSNPEKSSKDFADKLLEAVLDNIKTDNEWHYFPVSRIEGRMLLAYIFLKRIIDAPEKSVHMRKLSWIANTHFKYISRKLCNDLKNNFYYPDAVLENGLNYKTRNTGNLLQNYIPDALKAPFHFSVLAKFCFFSESDSRWIAYQRNKPGSRLYYSAEELETIRKRNQNSPVLTRQVDLLIQRADSLLNIPVPEFHPAPSLNDRGLTNELNSQKYTMLNTFLDAFIVSGNNKYAGGVKNILISFIRQYEGDGGFRCFYNLNNPGPWDGQYIVHLFSKAYDLILGTGVLENQDKDRIIYLIQEIGKDISWTLANSNWELHNYWARWAGALGFLSCYWDGIPEARSWEILAERNISRIYMGILEDGAWYETTPDYHLFTLDPMFKWFSAAEKLHNREYFNQIYSGRTLVKMFDWIIGLCPPGGEMPLFSDSRKFNLNKKYGFLAEMAEILRRKDYFVLTGASNITQKEILVDGLNTVEPKSVIMEKSGFGIFRNGWEQGDFYCAVKFGDIGGGHGHFDKSTFYIASGGHPWIVEPGYGFRNTKQHNTVVIDNKNQNPACGELVDWHQNEYFDLLTVKHNAYSGIEHRRTFVYLKNFEMLVLDYLVPEDSVKHNYDWMLQMDPKNGIIENNSWEFSKGGSGMKIFFPSNDDFVERTAKPDINDDEFPPNMSIATDKNSFVNIWRGKWSKNKIGPVVFASFITFYERDKKADYYMTQIINDLGIQVDLRGIEKSFSFGMRWDHNSNEEVKIGRFSTDARYYYVLPDDKQVIIHGDILKRTFK